MKKDNFGYTLIELLLAMMIYSVVAVLIANSLSNLLDSRKRNEAYATRLAEIQLAMSLLERDLEQMINRPIRNTLGQVDPAFVMSSKSTLQRIEFTRTGNINPMSLYPRSSLSRVAYQLQGSDLVRFNWMSLDRDENSTPNERIVLSQIDNLDWLFFDKENKTYTVWPPTAAWLYKLPRAIELTVTLKDKGKLTRIFVLPENEDVFISN